MFLFASPAAPGVERADGRGDRDDNEAFYARRRLQEEHRRRREHEERNRRAMTLHARREVSQRRLPAQRQRQTPAVFPCRKIVQSRRDFVRACRAVRPRASPRAADASLQKRAL
ncbi:hypothetical protein MRX96_042701 [Rhipicephalus microplus]